ncbi:MAG: DUF3891 family protein [Planctomycetaceae bacterium]|nr:DUF3891 family protein [Planctomycetaceae bacterium]
MIVRPADGDYILISQVDHARIAVEIARSWRLPSRLDDLRKEFLFAVEHHDDGWRDWERAPTIVDGAPRNFMDMPMPVATGIWSESVDVAAANSPWGGLWVSRHFCHLAELAIAHRTDPADRASAERFLAEHVVAQQRWRASLCVETDFPAELTGLHGVQFFDRLSLWLCCEERTAPQDFIDPAGNRSTWSPEKASQIRITGNGFLGSDLELNVPTISIPRQNYASDAELRAAVSRGDRGLLTWTVISTPGISPEG